EPILRTLAGSNVIPAHPAQDVGHALHVPHPLELLAGDETPRRRFPALEELAQVPPPLRSRRLHGYRPELGRRGRESEEAPRQRERVAGNQLEVALRRLVAPVFHGKAE